ncbi:hypothetical protein Phi17:1_gp33 [Cellulophaga phage phi17:1]|uniref:Uncharacterized protein n=1 Tax=Cellulophaga phage phi17:1 TaxID=1327980 RepID=R9ZYC0_9CAUD|nr:hypothetical protein Phi17:1_gp33 [Cellulophaga phage phi17:1]AGO48309.1 hypothetical protein Phi17:1_gp33 [Cellulophaga phage phi17:1]
MGMYTELIFGAELKQDTPENVIESLKYMMGDVEEKPENFPLPDGRCEWLFKGSSYYFGINRAASSMWFDDISESWSISTRSNIKNYGDEIESFLEWIKPYIDSGRGCRDMYAIVTYEESDTPDIYYLS